MTHSETVYDCTIRTKVKDLAPGDIFTDQPGLAVNVPEVLWCLPMDAADLDPLGTLRGTYAVVRLGDISVQPTPGDRIVHRRTRPGERNEQ